MFAPSTATDAACPDPSASDTIQNDAGATVTPPAPADVSKEDMVGADESPDPNVPLNEPDEVVDVSDDVLKVSACAIDVSDDVLEVSGGAVDVSEDVVEVSGGAVEVSDGVVVETSDDVVEMSEEVVLVAVVSVEGAAEPPSVGLGVTGSPDAASRRGVSEPAGAAGVAFPLDGAAA